MRPSVIKLLILHLCFISFCSITSGQTPFKINPATGLHAVDAASNPILNDRNWITTPVFEDQFDNPSATQNTKFRFSWLGDGHVSNDDFFWFAEDPVHDNMPPVTSGSPNQFTLTSPNNHFFYTSGGETLVKLVSRHESSTKHAYYRDYNATYAPVNYYIAKDYNYSTGVLISRDAYKYGYFEIRYKVNRPPNNQSKGLGQCFWLFADWINGYAPPNLPSTTTRTTDYSEIDIAENDPRRGLMSSNAIFRQTATSAWKSFTVADDCGSILNTSDVAVDQNNFHTYAFEWTPTEMNTYYDNRLARHMEECASLFDPMNIIIDIEGALTSGGFHRRCELVDPAVTNFPFEFIIDYARVYKLDNSTCSVIINSPSYNFATYPYGLKRSLVFGQYGCTGCAARVHSGMNVSLRAVESIELNDGFEVDNNANTEFFATVNGNCDN